MGAAWLYLGSYASTALADGYTAEPGSLHETEFIAPHTRPIGDEPSKQVYLVGYIFQKQGSELAWRDALDRLIIGGERSYGWGWVPCCSIKDVADNRLFGCHAVDLTQDCPVVTIQKDQPLLAHTLADGWNGVVRGTIEPLVGRETREMNGSDKSGFGGHLSSAEICWVPGSTAGTGEKQFRIGAKGVWMKESL